MVEQHAKALVPEIRFAGFTDPWEQRKLGELFEESDERASDREILSVSVANGIYPASESDRETNPGASLANYKIVHFGDVVYNSMRMWQGAVDASRYDGIVSPAYVVTRPTSEVYARFFARLLRQPMLLKQYQQVSQGNSKDTQVLKFDDFASIRISMPASENEQRQIGAFFDRLDSLITLHQRKYDKLCVLKKSMLDKMFPKGGSLYPEIRFAGFADPWEQRKLGEVAPLQRGFDLPVSQMISGPYPVVMSNGVGGWHSKYAVKGPGVVTGRSGTIGGLQYIEGDFWPHNTSLWVTSFNGNEPKFIYWLYSSLNLERFGSGSGVPTLNRNDVHDQLIGVPCNIAEQRRIGAFFDRLDSLITLHQRKLELLRNIKKSMLDKMFV
nr:restriction endonuclease subunit S [Bifidobacterium catenulatum]